MTANFPVVATVMSMVLGLSITRLLIGFVTVFRIRRTAAVDWVVLVWAAVLFMMQLQFWWAINQLPTLRPSLSYLEFVFLVFLTVMLFLSAALLLPSRGEDEQRPLRDYFDADGRYALPAISAFLALGFVANLLFFDTTFTSTASVADVPMIVLPLVAFFARRRRVQVAVTLAYAPLAAIDTYVALTT